MKEYKRKWGACLCKWVGFFVFFFKSSWICMGFFALKLHKSKHVRARGTLKMSTKVCCFSAMKGKQSNLFLTETRFAESATRTSSHTSTHSSTNSLCIFWHRGWGTLDTHTHFHTERGIERKKVSDYRIRSQYNMKLDYIPFNQVSLFYRVVTFSIW